MKRALFVALALVFVIFCNSFAVADNSDIQAAITQASTDDLLMLREWIDAELTRRFEAIGLTQKTETTYILNTSSHKFHIPSCEGVNHMKEKNKMEYQGDRTEVIALGYKPCGICHP